MGPGSASAPPAPPSAASASPPASAAASVGHPPSNAGVGAASSGAARASTEQASLGPPPQTQRLIAELDHSVIHFPTGGASAPASATDALKRAADEAKRLPPGYELQIAGYTDNTGAAAENVALSRERAEAVREALVGAGVNPDILVAKGYGSADPIASNDTPQGRLLNRRIEFQVVPRNRTVARPSGPARPGSAP